ncbi:unnamed protein product [Macrosiphum euphorbiae]|uniref:Uncharacterized protein n=1 Tax=Macrosiphum euphorbiae TaxID=13131 RepID=A0AAV0VZP6_9HEMI|nr:unnamed protein product [Macrosiphum euphorbiae]
MPLEFVLSQKGNQQLINKGVVYTTDKIKEDKHIPITVLSRPALRIKEIVEDFGNRDTSDYLQGNAHNFQSQSC